MPDRQPYRPHPALQRVLDDLARIGNPLDQLTTESIPQLWLQREILARNIVRLIPVERVDDLAIPARNHTIPLRIYTPADRQLARDGKLPILLFYHGGGWALGSIASYDSLTRQLANLLPAMVVSVDYRLAPEHPFPAGLEDAQLALEWVARNGEQIGADITRIGLAGDSSGGNLAAVVAGRAGVTGLPVACLALFYPSTHIASTAYPSYEQYGHGYWLTRKAVEDFRRFYLPNTADWTNPEASPLLAPDEAIGRLPPTLILTCGCDVLRDEGEAYARRLRANGVPVEHLLKEQLIHACLGLFNSRLYPDASELVEPILAELAELIRGMLGPGRRH